MGITRQALCFNTIQDDTELKHQLIHSFMMISFNTIQDDTELKPEGDAFTFATSFNTIQDDTELKLIFLCSTI